MPDNVIERPILDAGKRGDVKTILPTSDMPDFESFTSEFVISDDCQGLRLDQALARSGSGLGRRGAKRVLAEFRVEVDGKHRAAGFRVAGGQLVRVSGQEGAQERGQEPGQTGAVAVHVAGRNTDFAALVKPAGMHCERLSKGLCVGLSGQPDLSGKRMDRAGPTLEETLPELLPDVSALLLNRLDQAVSGLVLVALHERAARDYAVWQDQGRVRKEYLALLHGQLNQPLEIRSTLDTAKRRKVRALNVEDPDALRWTRVTPLVASQAECQEIVVALERSARLGRVVGQAVDWAVDWDAIWERNRAITPVRVEILKGRRHQIRAHLASTGYPVLFDPLYGPGPDVGWIGLHHRQIALPGFRADSGSEFRPFQEYGQGKQVHF